MDALAGVEEQVKACLQIPEHGTVLSTNLLQLSLHARVRHRRLARVLCRMIAVLSARRWGDHRRPTGSLSTCHPLLGSTSTATRRGLSSRSMDKGLMHHFSMRPKTAAMVPRPLRRHRRPRMVMVRSLLRPGATGWGFRPTRGFIGMNVQSRSRPQASMMSLIIGIPISFNNLDHIVAAPGQFKIFARYFRRGARRLGLGMGHWAC